MRGHADLADIVLSPAVAGPEPGDAATVLHSCRHLTERHAAAHQHRLEPGGDAVVAQSALAVVPPAPRPLGKRQGAGVLVSGTHLRPGIPARDALGCQPLIHGPIAQLARPVVSPTEDTVTGGHAAGVKSPGRYLAEVDTAQHQRRLVARQRRTVAQLSIPIRSPAVGTM